MTMPDEEEIEAPAAEKADAEPAAEEAGQAEEAPAGEAEAWSWWLAELVSCYVLLVFARDSQSFSFFTRCFYLI